MRLLCYFQGHRLHTIREEWIDAKEPGDFTSLLRFNECSHCKTVEATVTHPEDYKSRWSVATKFGHRTVSPELYEEKA